MISKSGIKLLAAAVAMAIGSTAMANTAINATTTGDLFLNIEDSSNNTSYLFDTGVTQANFNSNSNYSFNLSGDAALSTFLGKLGTDNYDYSVMSATKSGGGPASVSIIDITGNSLVTPTNISNSTNNQAQAAASLFLQAANLATSASSSSVVLSAPGDWDQGGTAGLISHQIFNVTLLPYGEDGALNTALAFYHVTGTTATTLAGTWDFSTATDSLTYNGAPVPLPTPVLLLLSGLGLMGAVARRAKAAV